MMPTPIYWCRGENDANVITPDIGPTTTIYGSLNYAPCHFNNGINIDRSITPYQAIYVPGVVNAEHGSLSLYFSPDDLGDHYIFTCNEIGLFLGNNGGSEWYCAVGSSSYSEYGFDLGYTGGDIFHLAFTWDASAGAGQKLLIYKDNVLVAPNAIYGDSPWSDTGYHYAFMGNYSTSYQATNYSAAGILDNPKIYDSTLTDFSADMVFEGDGIPVNVSASKGTFSDHVTISWDTVVGDSIQYDVLRSDASVGPYVDISGWQSSTSFSDTSVVLDRTYYYKVKARSMVNSVESDLSAYDSGYSHITPASLVYRIPNIRQPRIILNGFDIYGAGYVAKMFNVTEQKTFARSKLIFNDFNLDVNNFDDLFSRDNPKSLFHGQRLYMPIQIYNRDGLKIFDGVTLNLTRDHIAKTASIEVSDTMATFSRTKIEYASTTWETPAMAVKNIMDSYGASANYDLNSLTLSDAAYKLAGAYIKCDVKLNANTYLTSFIEKLAEIGCADAYIHNNKIRFDHWTSFTRPVSSLVNLDISDLISAPKISILFSEVVNDYRIRYTGDNGIAVTDQVGGHNIGALSRKNLSVFSLPEIRTSDTAQIAMKDKTTAIYMGECLIRRTHTNLMTNPNPLQVIDISLPIQDREWLDITSHFALTFPEEGWDHKIFEVMKWTADEDANVLNLTAYDIGS